MMKAVFCLETHSLQDVAWVHVDCVCSGNKAALIQFVTLSSLTSLIRCWWTLSCTDNQPNSSVRLDICPRTVDDRCQWKVGRCLL